jgi:histidyl-tRNA synthetase
MSSSGYPQIEFGYDDGSDTDAGDEEDDHSMSADGQNANGGNGHNNLALTRTRSSSRFQRPFKTILYISMEYCEKRTLRDLIKRELYKDKDEVWRLFRQVLEALAHIHGLNVVHRDLKPENVFIDAASNVRIGDFGLATSGQHNISDQASAAAIHISSDLTRSIGTAFYVAPEVRSSVGGTYTNKVDMYSLGVIFFEMCYRPVVGMERAQVVEKLRQKEPALPADFNIKEEPVQADIILSLLNHSPKERPSSSELLQSGKLPVQMESETIRQALAGLSDPKSPYYHKMMSALFTQPTKQAQDLVWDMGTVSHSASDLLLQGLVKQRLISIFRHHGAVETPRSVLFPRSGHYGPNVVQLLNSNGNLVQLPYDLTLPYARTIAKHEPAVQRSFAFGPVFRDRQHGGQPQSFGEVDFDIVSTDSLDLALKEAEVIKVLDEITCSFPSLEATRMCFHINHSDLLSLIFNFCRIETSIRQLVSDTLSKLNVQQWTWQKIKTELRSPLIGVSATSVEDLQRFDFRGMYYLFRIFGLLLKGFEYCLSYLFWRAQVCQEPNTTVLSNIPPLLEDGNESDHSIMPRTLFLTSLVDTPAKAVQKLKVIFEGTDNFERASSAIAHLKDVVEYAKLFDVRSKIYINPLGSLKEKFCKGGIIFSCLYDRKVQDVFAAGGRYDSLIREHRHRTGSEPPHAVGFNLAWEKIARLPKAGPKGFLKRPEEDVPGIWNTKRVGITTLNPLSISLISRCDPF